MFDFSSHITGITPHERLFCLRTLSLVVAEMIGHSGRNFEICLAVAVALVAAGESRGNHDQREAQAQDSEVLFHVVPLLTE